MGTKQRYRADRREGSQDQNLSVKVSVDGLVEERNVDGGVEIEVEGQQEQLAPQPYVEVSAEPETDPASVTDETEEDPIEVLKKQFEEVKAEKEAADRRAFEAAQREREHATRLQQQQIEAEQRERERAELVQQHAVKEFSHHKAVLEQAYALEEKKLGDVKKAYADALRFQDFEAAAEAQIEITNTTQNLRQYAAAYQNIGIQEKEAQEAASRPAPAPKPAQPAQPAGDPFEEALRPMHPKVAAWAREHKDDVTNPQRQELAFAADKLALARGYAPGSDEYISFLDESMGYKSKPASPAPAQETAQPVATQQPRASKRPSAAPSSAVSSSGGTPAKVYLTEDDRRMAKDLKMTDKEYAVFKLKANEGQLTPAQAGGRLQARYIA
jgi:hypothetical protein